MDGIANFFSVVPNPMVLVNTQGIVVLANERVCNLFGYEEGALAGRALSDLIPERFRESHMKLLAKYFQEPHVREMGIGMELIGLHADGSEFPVEVSLNPYGEMGTVYTLASLRAIKERRATEIRIRHLNRIL